MIELRQYVDSRGRSPFGRWFAELDAIAAAKVTTGLTRLALGSTGGIKPVGAGVLEWRIDFGPGYRIYFARDGVAIVILLGGGTKKRQQSDIGEAQARWIDYRRRKT